MRAGSIGGVLVLLWLIIGGVAAYDRGYFKDSSDSCAKASTVAVTIVAGPLNWLGINPKIKCDLPAPSK